VERTAPSCAGASPTLAMARQAAARPAVEVAEFDGRPSFLQEQWWRWVARLESEERHFPELTIQIYLSFPDTPPAMVEDALRNVVARHDSLRYRFLPADGALRASLNRLDNFNIRRFKVGGNAPRETAEDLRAAFFSQPVPANGEWLTKAAIIRRPGATDALMAINHIVADATSNRMLELEILRHVLNRGDDRPRPRQYAEYVQWERDWFGKQAGTLTDYWRARPGDFRLLSPSTGRPLQWAPGTKQSCKSLLPAGWRSEIRKCAGRLRTTPFLVYLTALALSIYRWSGQERFLMRNIGDGRLQNSALLPMVGLLTVADPIEAEIEAGGDFERTLRSLEARYRSSLGLRLPDIHAFPPGLGVTGSEIADVENNFAVNINYMPSSAAAPDLEFFDDGDSASGETWPPKVYRAPAEERVYSVSPLHLFVTEGKASTVVDFKMHAGMLDTEDQNAIINAFFDCLASQLKK